MTPSSKLWTFVAPHSKPTNAENHSGIPTSPSQQPVALAFTERSKYQFQRSFSNRNSGNLTARSLRRSGHELCLFCAEFSLIDDHDIPGRRIAGHYFTWSIGPAPAGDAEPSKFVLGP